MNRLKERLGKDLSECFAFERAKQELLGFNNEPVLNKGLVNKFSL